MVCYGIFWSGQYQTKMVETVSSLPLIIKKWLKYHIRTTIYS